MFRIVLFQNFPFQNSLFQKCIFQKCPFSVLPFQNSEQDKSKKGRFWKGTSQHKWTCTVDTVKKSDLGLVNTVNKTDLATSRTWARSTSRTWRSTRSTSRTRRSTSRRWGLVGRFLYIPYYTWLCSVAKYVSLLGLCFMPQWRGHEHFFKDDLVLLFKCV